MDGKLEIAALSTPAESGASCSPARQMVKAELAGRHTHSAEDGTKVHIYERDGRFIARGRFQNKPFGQTLGSDRQEAEAGLRRLLVEIDDGAFQRPSDSRRRPWKNGAAPKLTIRQLANNFLADVRRLRGRQTADAYEDRLTPVIEFSENPKWRKRWPLASEMDRDFAIELRSFLHARAVTRNGRPGGAQTRTSVRQVFNVLDCVRTMLNWAKKPGANQLPAFFQNPFTPDIVGQPPHKDPLRPVTFSPERRIELVQAMDAWQLRQFAIPLCLPLRPDELTGLLISEIDFAECLLKFGSRFGDRDFNKGKQAFCVPFPPELTSLLRSCAGERLDGPLLLSRAVWEGRRKSKLSVHRPDDVAAHFDSALMAARADEVQTAQDTKALFRKLLIKLGGVSPDALAKEFKGLIESLGFPADARFYDLRAAVSTDLARAGVSHLAQRNVTGHTTHDIMNEYVSIDIQAEMRRHFERIRPLLAAIAGRAAGLQVS